MNNENKKVEEEEGCALDETCVMDTDKKLSEEKNKELMEKAMFNLRDLL